MKASKRTLEGLVDAIRSGEQRIAKMRASRDRFLKQAREFALEVATLSERAAGLREILADLDAQAYEQAFGEPFVEDDLTGRVEPSREQLLTSMRDLLAFLETTPEISVTQQYWPVALPRVENDAERLAAVDAIAAILGEEPEYSRHYSGDDKQQYGVQRSFGYVKLYADVVVDRESDARPADAAEAGGEVLDKRMLGMGGPAAEESADGQVMHAAAYAGPHFGLESAHALCGGKGWLTEDVPLVTCAACAALLLGDQVDETQRVVDAYLDGQSELDQALVREELQRQAETAAGQEDLVDEGSGMVEERDVPCPRCGGDGLDASEVDVAGGDAPVVCERCGGLGIALSAVGRYCADCGRKRGGEEKLNLCVNLDGEQFSLCDACYEARIAAGTQAVSPR